MSERRPNAIAADRFRHLGDLLLVQLCDNYRDEQRHCTAPSPGACILGETRPGRGAVLLWQEPQTVVQLEAHPSD